jgi:assimilatory nitrate reductase catalytic subunit
MFMTIPGKERRARRRSNRGEETERARVTILIGTELVERSPDVADRVWGRADGSKIIVIDSRMTAIARAADLFLDMKSGRDSALVNGILHVMIKRGWIDPAFAETERPDFDGIRHLVRNFTPNVTEEITGVPASSIVRAAEIWGPAETSMLLHARSDEHLDIERQGYVNLARVVGRLAKPGCGYCTLTAAETREPLPAESSVLSPFGLREYLTRGDAACFAQ